MKSEAFEGTGHGKLILTGEHSVVYGYPAIALGISAKTTVRLEPISGISRINVSERDERFCTVVETLCPTGFEVSIRSELPLGRGMGSSAAVAVGLARALAKARAIEASAEALFDTAMRAEQIFHSNPSGLDAQVSLQGGVLRFVRGQPPKIEALRSPNWDLIVMDSGCAGDTSVMVDGVAAQRPRIDPLLEQIGQLTERAQRHLHDPTKLGALLNENHKLLCDIGVSNKQLNQMTTTALEAGALGAKLSGAGGGGVVIALTTNADPVLQRIRETHPSAFVCSIWSKEKEPCKSRQ